MYSGQLFFIIFTTTFLVVTQGFLLPCTNSYFQCGKPTVDPYNFRIVGGQKAQRGAWPWLVVLTEKGNPYCGGAIINERFILTAAHCFIDDNVASQWKAIGGKLRLDRAEPGQKTIQVKKIIVHEHFNTSTVENDIALLLLEEPFSFSTLIKPICLPKESNIPKTGENCLLAGWGDTTVSEADKVSLNQVLLPVISDNKCSMPGWYGTDFIPATTFCAGYEEGGKDACVGDSGGPLICKSGDVWVAKGIASWGYGCAEYRWPGIYTDVTKYLSWIRKNMDNNYSCQKLVV